MTASGAPPRNAFRCAGCNRLIEPGDPCFCSAVDPGDMDADEYMESRFARECEY